MNRIHCLTRVGWFLFMGLVLAAPQSLLAEEAPETKAPAQGQEAETGPAEVTLDLTETELARALAEVQEQTQWEMIVAPDLKGQVSLKADDLDGETAIDRIVEQCGGRWLRVYVVDAPEGEKPYRTSKEMTDFLIQEQRARIVAMTFEDQQKAFIGTLLGRRRGQRGIVAAHQPGADGTFLWDPLQPLRAGEYHERISVSLEDVTFLGALDALWKESWHPVVATLDPEVGVTLEANDEPLEQALDRLCKPLKLRWSRVYLVVELAHLTGEQLSAHVDQGWNMMWDTFFDLEPTARKKWLDWGINLMKSIPEETKQQIRQSEFAPRMVERATAMMTRFSPDKRREIAPLAQMLLHVFAGP